MQDFINIVMLLLAAVSSRGLSTDAWAFVLHSLNFDIIVFCTTIFFKIANQWTFVFSLMSREVLEPQTG